MAELNVMNQNSSSIFDFAATEETISTKMFQTFLESLKFHVSFFEEYDGSFTGILEELDLIENAPSKEDCIVSLLEAMKEYAKDFYNEFSLWSSAPNRKNHIPYVSKILSEPDSELMRNIVCRSGKS